MKKLALIASVISSLFLSACRDDENVGPDLTTSLIGQFPSTYFIDPIGSSQTYSGANSFVRLERKNNNTLNVEVRIDGSGTQINDRFEATVTPTNLDGDGLGIPGLRSRYRLTYGAGSSDVNLYKDGKVRGVIGYVKSNQQIVLGFR